MIQCANENCKIVQFYQQRVKIKQFHKRTWYCSECKKLNESGEMNQASY